MNAMLTVKQVDNREMMRLVRAGRIVFVLRSYVFMRLIFHC